MFDFLGLFSSFSGFLSSLEKCQTEINLRLVSVWRKFKQKPIYDWFLFGENPNRNGTVVRLQFGFSLVGLVWTKSKQKWNPSSTSVWLVSVWN